MSCFDYSDVAACCGFIGFNNMTLKHIYIDNFFSKMYELTSCNEEMRKLDVCPNIILEQFALMNIVTKYKFSYKELFHCMDILEKAKEFGYTHVIGKYKYEDETIQKTKEMLSKINQKLYRETQIRVNF